MKKKLLIAILTATAALSCAFGLVACKNDKENDTADKWGSVYTVETAYAAAKDLGYGGTLEEFLESIKGKDGKDGVDGKDGTNGIDGKDGVDGKDGTNGTDGVDGKDGADGVGVKNAFVNEKGELILELTNDSTVNCGNISAYYESLQYAVIKEDNEVVGYSVLGLGTVTDTDLVIPSSYRGKPVKTIAASAFLNRGSLTSVTIPSSVTSIADNAFSQCGSLTSVTIPSSVTLIADSAFSQCSGLTSVTIPSSVTSIADNAFSQCGNLTSVTISAGVTSIGRNAFSQCTNINELYYLGSIEEWCDISFSLDSVPSASKFYLNGELVTDLILPDTVKEIKDYAFSGFKGLTSLTVSEGITTIGASAFSGCSSLTSVIIPEGVTTIGSSAFNGCSSLTSVIIPEGVTTIGSFAFKGCSSLISVIIPDSVTTIGGSAFQFCRNIETVKMPTAFIDNIINRNHTSIVPNLNNKLKTVELTSGDTISNSAFSDCNLLTSIIIPDSVSTIGGSVFSGCSSLTSVVIPESVTSISPTILYGCDGLTTITVETGNTVYHSAGNCIIETESKTLITGCKTSIIPADGTVTTIGSHAFSGCSSLENITIPAGITSMGDYAFAECSSLTSVTLPDSLTLIGRFMFNGCLKLTDIYYVGTQAQWDNVSKISWDSGAGNLTVHYLGD